VVDAAVVLPVGFLPAPLRRRIAEIGSPPSPQLLRGGGVFGLGTLF
jgi:hypothetical protein